jgi:hypothetical protein
LVFFRPNFDVRWVYLFLLPAAGPILIIFLGGFGRMEETDYYMFGFDPTKLAIARTQR